MIPVLLRSSGMKRFPAAHQHRCEPVRSCAPGSGCVCAVLIVASFSLAQAAGANLALQTLYEFESNPKNPRGVLVQGSDGNLYGTTVFGGTNSDNGTVFQITPAGVLTLLQPLQEGGGPMPLAGLQEGGDGLFFCTAENGAR